VKNNTAPLQSVVIHLTFDSVVSVSAHFETPLQDWYSNYLKVGRLTHI
jgi:hypothetical protein